LAIGAVHPDRSPEEALSDLRGPDARSAQIGGPEGIAQLFQVIAYNGEPSPSSRASNLLAKDCWRLALSDEASELRPEVSGV